MSDRESRTFFVFPGQGSQYVGMGRDLCDEYATARSIYERASSVLGFDLSEISFKGPEEQLNLTRYTQPALLAHSVACLEVFRDRTDGRIAPDMAGGHSLGEYSALVAAGSLTFETAMHLVQKRGELMGTHGTGEMTAFPLDLDTIRPVAEQFHCAIAGCNLPDQTVIGGKAADLEQVEAHIAEHFPRKRAVRLKTEGAFHTYYMVTAAMEFRAVLEDAQFEAPGIRVLSNFTGGFHEPDPDSIRARLFYQLFNPVLWHAGLFTALNEGVGRIVEFGGGIGPGEPEAKRPNLEGMIKKSMRGTDFEVQYFPVINRQTLSDSAGALSDAS